MTTSSRRHTANQRNAAKSTGPRTATGKKRASQNARRHGLAVSIAADEGASEQIRALADLIAGDHARDPVVYSFARQVAEAQLDLQRVRIARTECLGRWIAATRTYIAAYPGPYTPILNEQTKAQFARARAAGRMRSIPADTPPGDVPLLDSAQKSGWTDCESD